MTRTGIRERRIASEQESTSSMGMKAALLAIQDAKIEKSDIDCIIVATTTPDHILPSTACLIQKQLEISNIPAMDIQAACSGYIYGLLIAQSFVEKGIYRNILLIASEKLSSIVDYQDRATCVLFGDGATAAIVSREQRKLAINGVSLGADGSQAELLIVPAGGSVLPASQCTIDEKMHCIKMSGNEVFKHAVRRMEKASKSCLEMINMKEEEIAWLIPHQANERIIDAIAKRFPFLPDHRVFKKGVQKYGNTSASSVGIALDELMKEEKIEREENILLTVFGSGFTWGATILTYVGEKA
jgi:3-oxoacyl-[acyl-carrier-protein] synthase-3